MSFRKPKDLLFLDVKHEGVSSLLLSLCPFNEDFIQLACGIHVQARVEHAHVNPRLEGRIDVAHSVARQKQYTAVILFHSGQLILYGK